MKDNMERTLQVETLPQLPLRGLVLYPQEILHFDVGRNRSLCALNQAMAQDQRIFLTAQKDVQTESPEETDLFSVGVVAKIKQVLKLPDGNVRVLVEGSYRAKRLAFRQLEEYDECSVCEYPLNPLPEEDPSYVTALMRTIKNLFEEYCDLSPKMPKELVLGVMAEENPNHLVEYIAGNIILKVEQKQALLEESDILRRLEALSQFLDGENEILSLERDIYDRVKESLDKNQREYFLREQMRVISAELGEGEDVIDEAQEYRKKLKNLTLSEETRTKLSKEIDKLAKMPPMSQETVVLRNYLDWCLELPWNHFTKEKIDIPKARKILDHDHYGLEKVKERVLEMLAVRKLAPSLHGQILCLVGPPGVGKTSIAKSVAKALGRNYVRVSLGGVKDEAEIRGHRRTYIGSMPGRIITALKQAGSQNPLFLLDEVDKLGNDFRGDPASALLEVLDGEQNGAFVDHYIEVPFDLSQVLFFATANTTESIPRPLLDRMELIELPSYTREEKFQIAKKHLLPKQMKEHGIAAKQFRMTDGALYSVIDYYTREAGVRRLERNLAAVLRKAAKYLVEDGKEKVSVNEKNLTDYLGVHKFKIEQPETKSQVGLVNGLAWTSVGGETLPIEICLMEGSGKLELTGSLGDVMKESARTAISCVRSRANSLGIAPDFYKNKDLHLHAPEGAVPKDGPSAGITMATAIVSALTDIPVRQDVAMTGEITLRGRVLPIGGLREKSMAAYRNGIKTVVIPADNLPDLEEVADVVKKSVRFVPAATLDEVLPVALERMPSMAAPVK